MKTMITVSAVAAAMLVGGVRPAAAQAGLGAVACVGSELETIPSTNPVRRRMQTDEEVIYRVGVKDANRDEVEADLRSQLDAYPEVWCAWSDIGDGHVVIIQYTGVVRQDLTIDPEDPRFQAFSVGYGTSREEAEQFATRLDDRFVSYNDGSGYEVLVQETWSAGGAGAGADRPGERPATEVPARRGGAAVPGGPGGSMAPGTVFSDCTACPEMVVVPAGSFMMGSPTSDAEGFSDERPRHTVRIGAPFAVGVYEVTFAEWDACVRAGGCGGYSPDDEGWGRGSRPVMNVSWEDARAYVQWLSRETGQRYRLLTEAEWEYVARAGTTTGRYWGQGEAGQCRYANGDDDAPCPDGYQFTAPVGSFQPNAFGLYDVLGNVREWTEDCWNRDYSGAPTNGSAWQAGDCSERMLRGGSWGFYPMGPSVRRSVAAPWPGTGTASTDSVSPGPSIDSCFLTSLPRIRVSRGRRPPVAARDPFL